MSASNSELKEFEEFWRKVFRTPNTTLTWDKDDQKERTNYQKIKWLLLRSHENDATYTIDYDDESCTIRIYRKDGRIP